MQLPTPRPSAVSAAVDPAPPRRQVYFHDPLAPVAGRVAPSAYVAVPWLNGTLLLVRRRDSGTWELPGGHVDVGETAVQAAVRETAEETGVHVEVTDLAGLFTDPGHVVRGSDGEVRQQFTLIFHARAISGTPRGDQHETDAAAWVPVEDLAGLPLSAPMGTWIARVLATGETPYLG